MRHVYTPPNQAQIADGVGWERPSNSRNFHCFTLDGRALCRKWMVLFKIVPQADAFEVGHDECKACRRKLSAYLAKLPTKERSDV